ncbi:ADP-ribose pyrophosphatase YjhB, NUDIX family [Geosporobacter subterraneus DSM 17957]|uniref:ADP-ribose pyrophosphatase YjhB, NUDIX family n=1 Tax=Geosporobacter subterraneus DSM 17957 TaxID=1121919 RepID=A0A1M6GL07_9FIRM|nr:NUDIX domain-containing protein [Geosporobacter subterraneus]SHJ10619.1 ADP-ribose pyrophosphatase YjhB, NUDIX family [Geosporobacter subterraneus DSM 17957]
MFIRVRAAAIIFNQKNELLLVFHRDPETKEEWLTLPGGGIEGDESITDALVREVREECCIECQPGRLVYVREYIDWNKNIHHVGLFFTAQGASEAVQTGIDPEVEEQFIVESRFYSRAEIENTSVAVYPETIKFQLWEDAEKNFTGHTIYLGQQR